MTLVAADCFDALPQQWLQVGATFEPKECAPRDAKTFNSLLQTQHEQVVAVMGEARAGAGGGTIASTL